MNVELTHFDSARRALAEAHTIDEVKQVRDQAEALRLYFRQAENGLEMQNQCAAIKLRAERRAGEMLGALHNSHTPLQLREQGVTPMQSHRWQRVASVPEGRFEAHIAEAMESGELTTAGMLKAAQLEERRDRGERPPQPLPTGMFTTIVADPPWEYEDATARGAAARHYSVMSVEAIAQLPVGELAAADAHLYLWITNPHLPIAWPVIEAWGFEYKTMLTWVKPQMGTGRYFRGATEHILFCAKGNLPLRDRGIPNWFEADRQSHSEKPADFYELVERASHGPYVELFARKQREGWGSWGDEL